MLFVVADEGGLRAAEDVFRRVVEMHGAPCERLDVKRGVLGAWGRTCSADPGGRWLSSGTTAISVPDTGVPLFEWASTAAGDFVLVGIDGDGLVLTSGGAGGYRPIYVAFLGRGPVVASTSRRLVRGLVPERPQLGAVGCAG